VEIDAVILLTLPNILLAYEAESMLPGAKFVELNMM